ncbi:hypothetical protein PHYSODRAFT_322576 [Phytophthora sojae]|uniref:Uncharacterized protein n=1 Tax=Phytophthora sojae (strain P6497) TaxID=1094619 RepID=G4YDW4_PHYSP|nr:hypothetical protein PHYSODRAFT_322576 [Phytophthora sojae]EGZ28982.1 hypothetical protein PHYSODRAFT_322576 [Phytophthora sojae]|eukprot:XP_009516257.1 hypothetical protein PHYSODRAFT_322576 [Phytophthora sojae]
MRSVETGDPNLSPVEHASEHDGNPLDLSLDVNMDSDVSQPTTPTVDFPSDAFAHPPKCLQSRRSGPPPTASSQSWNSPNFWSHLEGLDPELECLETNPDENGDSGYQIVVTRISPVDESVNSNEYGYYHEKKKSKVQLSTNPVTVREWIPVMAESISKSKQLFQEEQKETLSTDINSEAIMKEINKNRLAFLIKVSRWMRQKSELVEELARVHLWFRCVHSSVANGNKFPTKWKKLTGFAAPSSRPALFKRTAEMLVSMSDEAKLYDTSLALALFELMLIAAAPGIFNNDYWIQTLAKTHVPWIQTSEGRLLHPNHSIMHTLTQLRDGQSWLTEEAAMLQMQVRDGHLLLAAGPLHIEC